MPSTRIRDDTVQMRAEAEAPFRSLRLVLSGFSVVSAGLGFLISVPQLLGALGGARGVLPLEQVGQNVAIDAGAVALFAFFFRQDWLAREKKLSRLRREETLGVLPLRLASGRVLQLADLRGSARVVLAAGTRAQVAAALRGAEGLRGELEARGVLLLLLPLYEEGAAASEASDAEPLPPLAAADQRWRAEPLRLPEWRAWFDEQLSYSSKAKPENGLFVGLRLDGRVRSSGSGAPPWARYAAELAPLQGEDKWVGFFDGFDGRV